MVKKVKTEDDKQENEDDDEVEAEDDVKSNHPSLSEQQHLFS